MKKALIYFIFASLLLSYFNASNANNLDSKKVSSKQKIEFVTKDKNILVGDLYLASKQSNKPLIVCLHSFSMNSLAYQTVAKNLQGKGYNVLTMDLRGHGRSVYNEKLKVKSRYQFDNNDWQKLPKDVVQSINFVKANYAGVNCDDIIIIGADIGASAGVLASITLKKPPQKMVLISPVLNFKGLILPIKTTKFYNTKMFYVTTKSDRVFLNFYTSTPAVVKNYPLGGPGTQLIKVNPEAVNDIVNFIVN